MEATPTYPSSSQGTFVALDRTRPFRIVNVLAVAVVVNVRRRPASHLAQANGPAALRPRFYNQPMPSLGALAHAAALPLGWRVAGLYRSGDLWVAPGEGPAFDDYTSGAGQYAEQALRRLSDRLRKRRGLQSG